MDNNWNFLLSEFRRLGGTADNVIQKEGEYGRGIFSLDPDMTARIFTPAKLLVKKDDIYLENNKLKHTSISKRISSGIVLVPEDRQGQGLVQCLSVLSNTLLSKISKKFNDFFLKSNLEK